MSFGGGEFSGETSYDSVFLTPSGAQRRDFHRLIGGQRRSGFLSRGSPNILSVGGTHLNVDSAGNIISETSWSGSGGGISSVEGQPSYQTGIVTQPAHAGRTPTVAYDSDPNTGFPVYDSYNNSFRAAVVRNSAAPAMRPAVGALIAIADQGRIAAGLGTLDGRTDTLPKLYALPASDFHDIPAAAVLARRAIRPSPATTSSTGRGSPFAKLGRRRPGGSNLFDAGGHPFRRVGGVQQRCRNRLQPSR